MSETFRRRWTVPAVAAAFVLGIVGVGALVGVTGDDAGGDRARLSGADAATGCAVLTSATDLAGFERVVQTDHAAGTLSFWVDGDRWLVCDDISDLVAGAPIDVWAPPQQLGRDGFGPRDLAYRVLVVRDDGGAVEAVHLVAGGKLMTDMETIAYTFPDGHREEARIVQAGGQRWWFVTYTATEGPLLAAAADRTEVGRTIVELLTPSADEGTDGPMIGGAAQAFVVPLDRTPPLVDGTG